MLSDMPSDSVKNFSDQVVNDPSSLLFGSLADFYRENGLYQEAINICLTGLESHPDNIDGRLVLAQCYRSIDELEKARAELTRVLSVQPQHSLAKKVLAELDKSVSPDKAPFSEPKASDVPGQPVPDLAPEPGPENTPESGIAPRTPESSVAPDPQSFHKGAQAMIALASEAAEKPKMEYMAPEPVKATPENTTVSRSEAQEAVLQPSQPAKTPPADDRTVNSYTRILNEVIQTPQVFFGLLVDESGYPVASAFARQGGENDEESAGALSALVFSTASQAMQKVKLGELERVVIDTKNEKIFLNRAGTQVLMVAAESSAKTGLVAVNVKRAIDRIKSLSS